MVDVITRETLKLTDEQKESLKAIGPDITWLENELRRMKRAGIEPADMEEKLAKLKELREGLLREYSD